jgi:hypothetical protein
MRFEEAWEKYDFTESILLGMYWENSFNYTLRLDYYWDLTERQETIISTKSQEICLILEDCIRLYVNSYVPSQEDKILISENQSLANFGTILGWELITPSPWIKELGLSPEEWFHLSFQVGKGIEILCRSLTVREYLKENL